ncbi:MAG: hypothetical protein IJM89_02895 [Bacteroidales bacterium]|nr:hypothetical protein [Bacteroidales bacterium]
MRKFFISLFAICILLPGFSQDLSDIQEFIQEEEGDPSILVQSKDGDLALRASAHVGYGFHSMKSSIFQPARSTEFFLNVLRLGVYPNEFLAVELNTDIEYNSFKASDIVFYLQDGILQLPMDDPSYGSGKVSRSTSSFNYFCVNFPVLAKFKAGKVAFGAGAEASFNFGGSTWYRFKSGSRTTTVRETGARLNLFTYGFIGVFSYDSLALFVKWYPKSSKIVPGGAIDFNHMTFGIAFGL